MLKKALQIVTTFGILTAGYLGYSQGFAMLASLVGGPESVPIVPYSAAPSLTSQQTHDLAVRGLGANHWAADMQRAKSYYDVSRGYYMFFIDYQRENEGKRIRFSPFALIWLSKDGKAIKTIQANSGYLDFDKPFDMGRGGGEGARVIYARIEDQVVLHDDKGTPRLPADDLRIGPLTYLEYEEAALQLRTESHVFLKQGDMTAEGDQLTIDLRPNPVQPGQLPGASGFSGARTLVLHKNIHLATLNVGKLGVVPGGAQSTEDSPRPGDLRCDGPMRIDFPEPSPKDAPAGSGGPTIAQFDTNVLIRQGDPEHPEQCTGDHLHLTFVPVVPEENKPPRPEPPRKPEPESNPKSGDAAPAASGPLSNLVLRRAEVTGHAVWLQSDLQGIKAYGNELIYKRFAPAAPDQIYFRGDTTTMIEMTEHVTEGPDAGKVKSFETIRTRDVTIHQPLKPGDDATVIARGPGLIESRPDRGQSVERSASWEDQLIMETVPAEEPGQTRRRVTLIGRPELHAPTQGATLVARNDGDKIIAYLMPSKPEVAGEADEVEVDAETDNTRTAQATAAPEAPAASPIGDVGQIDWVEAKGDVLLVSKPTAKDGQKPAPERTIHALKQLDVDFTDPPADPEPEATPRQPRPSRKRKSPPRPPRPRNPNSPPSRHPNPRSMSKETTSGRWSIRSRGSRTGACRKSASGRT